MGAREADAPNPDIKQNGFSRSPGSRATLLSLLILPMHRLSTFTFFLSVIVRASF